MATVSSAWDTIKDLFDADEAVGGDVLFDTLRSRLLVDPMQAHALLDDVVGAQLLVCTVTIGADPSNSYRKVT